MNPNVDIYLQEGCGRCVKYQTPDCTVHTWSKELAALREIALSAHPELKEEIKWSQPCYTYKGKNIFIIASFMNHAVLAFFKGVLLSDPGKRLIVAGKDSQASRQFRFMDVQTIYAQSEVIKNYILEAIELEIKGVKVDFKREQEVIPVELQQAFDDEPSFYKAFKSLTPGRQRAYILHFSRPKQSKTIISRIEKWKPLIMNGIGLNDAYKGKK